MDVAEKKETEKLPTSRHKFIFSPLVRETAGSCNSVTENKVSSFLQLKVGWTFDSQRSLSSDNWVVKKNAFSRKSNTKSLISSASSPFLHNKMLSSWTFALVMASYIEIITLFLHPSVCFSHSLRWALEWSSDTCTILFIDIGFTARLEMVFVFVLLREQRQKINYNGNLR